MQYKMLNPWPLSELLRVGVCSYRARVDEHASRRIGIVGSKLRKARKTQIDCRTMQLRLDAQ
jgi:hypothetical protein